MNDDAKSGNVSKGCSGDAGGNDIDQGTLRLRKDKNEGEEQAITLRGGSIENDVRHCFLFCSHSCYNVLTFFALFYIICINRMS